MSTHATLLTEDERVELWKLEQWTRYQGFSSEDAHLLLAWRVDPHDSHRLLFRDGARTDCTIALALTILDPT
jgi:hypothetical protein